MTSATATTQWWSQETPIGPITVVLGQRGVCAISFNDASGAFAPIDHHSEPARDRDVARELDDWFAGRRREFAIDVDLGAVTTEFGTNVLDTLRREVPWGETVAYGELAAMAGRPGAARGVGQIMRSNPVPFVVPCHRVVAAGGRLGGYGGGASSGSLHIKRWLLAHEGVTLL